MTTKNHLVLIVDDEPVNLMMLARVLRAKFNVKTAGSGQEALALLKSETVALLITDQRMPGMTGTELMSEGRQIAPEMICILMTAESDMDTLMNAIVESGAIRVINKPWDPAKIVTQVEDALQKYEAVRKTKEVMDQLKRANQVLERIRSR
ncbi:MAG TPA: response regulator [Blastocatellia bacterium]|nr:response regulator [Blastocatellia bacterium]